MKVLNFKHLFFILFLFFITASEIKAVHRNKINSSISHIAVKDFHYNHLIPYHIDTICIGDTVHLNSNLTGLSYLWSPAGSLNYSTIPNPVASPVQTTTYQLAVQSITNNLITNGNFSSGNTGFTSSYTYTTNLWPEATYYIGTNPTTYHANFASCTDHTTGTGNMMIINGAGTPNINIWQQTVTVTPNTDYMFSCWLTSVTTTFPAQLQFFVNGSQIGAVFQATPINCNWNMFYNVWNSGTNTTAVISIKNQNIALSGNDYAIDDIYFAKYYTVYDSTKVIVLKPELQISNDDTICIGKTSNLSVSGANTYLWSNGQNTPNITVSPSVNTLYTVTGTDLFGCKADTFVNVILYEIPQISFLQDPFPAQGCSPLDVVFTDQSSPVMQTYTWNFGDGNTSALQNPNHTYTTPGNYNITLSVVTYDGCTDTLTLPNAVKVHENPIASFTASPTQVSLSYANVLFNSTASSSNVSNWSWDFGDPSVTDDISSIQNPTYLYLNQGTFPVWLYVETIFGCKDSTFLFIKVVEDSLVFPNIITPNGDGHNDYLDIPNLENLDNNKLVIYNRWGKKVYIKENYIPDIDKWDGSDLADGTYFYVLIYKGVIQEGEYKGTITILR